MTLGIAPERLTRAITHITEVHKLTEPLSYNVASNILKRLNAMTEGREVTVGEKHELLRAAASREPNINEAQVAFYRKVIHAYWLFAPKREKAES